MDKIKIQEIALEAGTSNAVLIEKAKELGFNVKAANSTLRVEEADKLLNYVVNGTKPKVDKEPKVNKRVVIKRSDRRGRGKGSTAGRGDIKVNREKREEREDAQKGEDRRAKYSKRVEEKSNRVEGVKPEEQQGGDGSKKVKVKRKRVGITVIKKADIKKPRIRIVKETKRDDEVKIKRVESKKDSDKSKISRS